MLVSVHINSCMWLGDGVSAVHQACCSSDVFELVRAKYAPHSACAAATSCCFAVARAPGPRTTPCSRRRAAPSAQLRPAASTVCLRGARMTSTSVGQSNTQSCTRWELQHLDVRTLGSVWQGAAAWPPRQPTAAAVALDVAWCAILYTYMSQCLALSRW